MASVPCSYDALVIRDRWHEAVATITCLSSRFLTGLIPDSKRIAAAEVDGTVKVRDLEKLLKEQTKPVSK
jgi:hypothetical protein